MTATNNIVDALVHDFVVSMDSGSRSCGPSGFEINYGIFGRPWNMDDRLL